VRQDADDARARRLAVTEAGRERLAEAVELWRSTNEAIEARVRLISLPQLRSSLEAIASD
jgi:DNA-binding MarR family transcriptional regulator